MECSQFRTDIFYVTYVEIASIYGKDTEYKLWSTVPYHTECRYSILYYIGCTVAIVLRTVDIPSPLRFRLNGRVPQCVSCWSWMVKVIDSCRSLNGMKKRRKIWEQIRMKAQKKRCHVALSLFRRLLQRWTHIYGWSSICFASSLHSVCWCAFYSSQIIVFQKILQPIDTSNMILSLHLFGGLR